MDNKKPGLSSILKDTFGAIFITFFSLCLTIGMYNQDAGPGFMFFGIAATIVGVLLIITRVKAAFKRKIAEDPVYEPGPWLQEFYKGRKNSRQCPNCGAFLGKTEMICYKCRTVVPLELDKETES